MPSTPRAMTIPKIVAQLMTADEVGWSFFDSTESCVVDAVSSALLIWAAVKGWVPWTSQSFVLAWMWNSRMACSVITVFGADVPVGSAPISWMTGCGETARGGRTALGRRSPAGGIRTLRTLPPDA